MSDELTLPKPEESDPSVAAPPLGPPPKAPEVLVLPRTTELDAATARSITSAGPTRLVVVAGMNGSGKTTLVASTYDRFLRGRSFAGYLFAWSETLIGFEQRFHLSRIASGLMHPKTERTRFSDRMKLLHLRVRKADGGPRRDVLFTDIFGEAFRDAKDSTEACRRLTFLPRADRLVVLLDGAELVDTAARIAAVAPVDDFLQRSLDSGMLGRQSHVDVATAKWDTIARLPPGFRTPVESYLTDVESRLRTNFADALGSFRTARIAARPEPPSLLGSGYGVEELLPAWVEEQRLPVDSPVHWPTLGLATEFDRYVLRMMGEGV